MVNLAKIIAVRDWARPTYPIKIQRFIGLAGYYWCFVEGFSSIVAPLTKFDLEENLLSMVGWL